MDLSASSHLADYHQNNSKDKEFLAHNLFINKTRLQISQDSAPLQTQKFERWHLYREVRDEPICKRCITHMDAPY